MAVSIATAVAAVLLVPSWPAQRPATPWPQEGSTVEYEVQSSFSAPDGSYHQESTARLALVFDGTRWSGTCTGQTTEVVDGSTSTSSRSMASGGQPAMAPDDLRRWLSVAANLTGEVDVAEDCRLQGTDVLVTGPGRHATAMLDERGHAVRRNAWLAEEPPESSPYQDVSAAWDRDTGLLLDWTRIGSTSVSGVRLVDTDAF